MNTSCNVCHKPPVVSTAPTTSKQNRDGDVAHNLAKRTDNIKFRNSRDTLPGFNSRQNNDEVRKNPNKGRSSPDEQCKNEWIEMKAGVVIKPGTSSRIDYKINTSEKQVKHNSSGYAIRRNKNRKERIPQRESRPMSLIDFISPNLIESDKLVSSDRVLEGKVHDEDTESMETKGMKTADEFPSLTTTNKESDGNLKFYRNKRDTPILGTWKQKKKKTKN